MLAAPEIAGDLYDSGGTQLSDQDAERLLLGCLIATPQAIPDAIQIVRPNDFFDPYHRLIFGSLERLCLTGDDLKPDYIIDAIGGPRAILFDDVTAPAYFAALVARAERDVDIDAVAGHIAACSERRAVGAADDVDLAPPFVSRFGGMRWEEIGEGTNLRYEWIIEDILPKGEITLGFGDSGTGKSFCFFDMGLSIARGQPFYGKNVEPGLVVYVAAEAGKGFSKRKIAYVLHHKLGDVQVPFYLMTRRPDFFSSDVDCDALIVEIRMVMRAYTVPLVMIVLDTLSALTPGMNENASQDVSRVRQRLQRLLDAFGVAIAVVHHKPKGGSTPRGHGSLTGDFETTIEFETTEMKSRDGLPVHRAIGRKQREGKKGLAWEFTLPVFDVGLNKWGNPETSCVAVPFIGQQIGHAAGFHATANELLFLNCLFEALAERGQLAPADLPASITRAVDLGDVRGLMKARAISGEDDETKADNRFRAAFKRAADALRAGAVIGYRKPLVWYTGKAVRGLTATVLPVEVMP